MPTLLVTGLDGFVGSALQASRERLALPAQTVLVGPPPGFDLRDRDAVEALVAATRPDRVLHLAAQSHVPTAISDPAATMHVNVVGLVHLLKALADQGFAGRFLYVSSADVYGLVAAERLPIAETQPLAPRNPYAASKAAAELLCQQWQRMNAMEIVVARPFNHTGPGQRPAFALSGFARAVASIRLGRQAPVIEVGDLDVTRDFTDVQDVLAAYVALLQSGMPGEAYNVCSGREHRLADLLRQMLDLAGVSAEVRVDPMRLRPAEQRRMCGSPAKLCAATGWRPVIPITDTLGRLIDYWHAALLRQPG